MKVELLSIDYVREPRGFPETWSPFTSADVRIEPLRFLL
jgi:hypothetical protein